MRGRLRERESHEEAGEELAKRESLTRKLVRSWLRERESLTRKLVKSWLRERVSQGSL